MIAIFQNRIFQVEMTFPSSFLRWGNLSFEKLDPCGRVQLFQNQLDFPKGRTPEMELGRKVNYLESTFPGQLFLYILGVSLSPNLGERAHSNKLDCRFSIQISDQ